MTLTFWTWATAHWWLAFWLMFWATIAGWTILLSFLGLLNDMVLFRSLRRCNPNDCARRLLRTRKDA